jgi:hypothetical protein
LYYPNYFNFERQIHQTMRQTIAILLFFISGFAIGQGYKINLNIGSGINQKIKLANYYVGNIYLKDSLQLDGSGSGVLQGDTLLQQGLYKIYLDDKNHFDFYWEPTRFLPFRRNRLLHQPLK